MTISEAVDSGAGVVFSARHCFMLEAISVKVQPVLQPSEDTHGDEVLLRDDFWPELLGRGKICGDERWLIGENARQEVVVLRFDF